MHIDLERLGVHESVGTVFPARVLVEYLEDLPLEVGAIGDDEIADCDAVVTLEYDDAMLECAWIHSIQAGVDRFPFETLEAEDVILTNSTGIHGQSVGETVAGYLLAFARRLHDAAANQEDHRWDPPAWDEAFTISGTTACVVGTGTLGTGVADVLGSLGVHVSGVRRSTEPLPAFDEMYANDDLLEAISDVDFVIATVPLTDETHHLFDAEAFAAMRENAYFVNVARGSVVDEPALVDALEAGDIAGAALDVFETEPLPEESPLWDLDEVIVSPHCAGFTRDYGPNIGEIVTENVARLERDDDLKNRVV
ncbi:D-2-hydroxyacid dehydrogenase [Halostagnicola larsenii XH-48]|uniref:D-2-hydroxyacid dehydrogenase n=1 Tax=Halostagnicola larsenii XH-48 TaxID=797299 RepID=W0JTA6_9EURY|nr:D-2-hydroxyacid dehydrogenase [Halostagnicola larsenii]AHG00475.1 D-2-hydroxyacid dehydrogenase [Halostagnicola larsenii XH-48]